MTKKDYELIAWVIHDRRDVALASLDYGYTMDDIKSELLTINDVAEHLAIHFAHDNSRFDEKRFLKACGLEA